MLLSSASNLKRDNESSRLCKWTKLNSRSLILPKLQKNASIKVSSRPVTLVLAGEDNLAKKAGLPRAMMRRVVWTICLPLAFLLMFQVKTLIRTNQMYIELSTASDLPTSVVSARVSTDNINVLGASSTSLWRNDSSSTMRLDEVPLLVKLERLDDSNIPVSDETPLLVKPERLNDSNTPVTDEIGSLRAVVQAIHSKTVRHLPVEGPLYPRWEEVGVDIQALLSFLEGFAEENATTVKVPSIFKMFPESPYVVDGSGYYRSGLAKDSTWKIMLRGRVHPTEEVARRGLVKVLQSLETSAQRWPKLVHALQNGGFPYFAWYGDFWGCNTNNWKNESIPLFTTCAKVSCKHAVPAPTYKSILDSLDTNAAWNETMIQYSLDYPWEQKKPKLVWRGSLTGVIEENSRWKLCALVTQLREPHRSLFDVGLNKIPERHNVDGLNLTVVGGLVDPISPMEEFQSFKAILDIDGNSWSSRFGKLLCYNSVVVKVEPEYVDFFHYRDLRAWKHYVPVDNDLSNLVSRISFVLDPMNDALMKQIAMNANDWCQQHMVRWRISEDYLDIWEEYVRLLELGNRNWLDIWNKAKQTFMENPVLRMHKVVRYYGL